MRKYLVFIILIAFFTSCTKNFEDFNEDKVNPKIVPADVLFTNAQINLADQNASANVNLNIWKLWAQYWTETTYTDEANYDIINRTIADNAFRTYYRDILNDLQQAYKLVQAEPNIYEEDPIIKQNKLYIIDLLQVYCFQRLVDIFGNIPYSEALDIDNLSPKYDDAFTIYQDLLSRTNQIIDGLNVGYGSFGDADLYYGGDVTGWLKFATGMKLRFAIMLADYNAGLAQTTAMEASAGTLLESNSDNAKLVYTSGTPHTNPIHEDLVLSGRKDFVPANTIIDIMNGLVDPRMDAYFENKIDTSADGSGKYAYVGGAYGYSSSYSNHSHINASIQVAEYPTILFSYVEQQFYLAEAAARGFTNGDPQEFYNSAITASFEYWGLTADDAAAYLEKEDVNYVTAPGDWKQKIATQAWIAYYVNGFTGYTTWRRLGHPTMNLAPSVAAGDPACIPVRFTYPVNEQTLNADNYYQAASAIGGDDLCTRIFWDVD